MPLKDPVALKAYQKAYYQANKERLSASQKERYEDNKEDISEAQKAYREANKESVYRRQQKWRSENKDKVAESQSRYQKRNRSKVNARTAAYRARKLAQTPKLSHEEVQRVDEMYWLAKDLYAVSGQEYHVDHIVPIARGGLHHPDNLQILPSDINQSKGAK